MLSGRPCRSVDVAAAQLIAREAGASLVFGELALDQAPLDLAARYEVAAGRDEKLLGTLLEVSAAPRRSARERGPGLVDWGLSKRAAAAVISGLPPIAGLGSDPAGGARGYSAAEVEAACRRAIARCPSTRAWARWPRHPQPS